MAELRYPIGIQTFSKIREEGYAYVDKTSFIPTLLQQGQFIFLSRPRRFGKSLLISTLKSFFEGRRELFKGLAIDTMCMDWTPSPVLHFDFNTGLYSKDDGLRLRLDLSLSVYEKLYGITPDNRTYEGLSGRFETIIRAAHEQTGAKVVVLIDEYDKPLLGLENHPEIFANNQKTLKSFFGNLKSMDEFIRFGFLTGVARFSKVSIFSDLNNLKDISLDDRYADICGWSERELIDTFRSGIEALAQKRNEYFDTTLEVLRSNYDGYLFTDGGSRLYNPFSVMGALDSKKIDPYWYSTATPTFLTDMIRDHRIDPTDINGSHCSRKELLQVDIESKNPLPLMFQTGYLTIDHYDEELDEYILRFPNREVEIGFAENLLPTYLEGADISTNPLAIQKFRRELVLGNPEAFMARLEVALKDLPGEDQNESAYRAATYLLCRICSLESHTENHSYKGRSDLEVLTRKYIYLFEFKYNRSVNEAMQQIINRDYAGRYALDSRKIYLVAANYTNRSNENRGLSYEIRQIN
ncbi:MAG: AAA family ATPase [Bacteroides sp.]|nr:AAA family ATPase [Bacteroides sp.]MDE6234563.1 ATP-binding protein [Muribaculaceae bacterium]